MSYTCFLFIRKSEKLLQYVDWNFTFFFFQNFTFTKICLIIISLKANHCLLSHWSLRVMCFSLRLTSLFSCDKKKNCLSSVSVQISNKLPAIESGWKAWLQNVCLLLKCMFQYRNVFDIQCTFTSVKFI